MLHSKIFDQKYSLECWALIQARKHRFLIELKRTYVKFDDREERTIRLTFSVGYFGYFVILAIPGACFSALLGCRAPLARPIVKVLEAAADSGR